jgi:hypothetical protein
MVVPLIEAVNEASSNDMLVKQTVPAFETVPVEEIDMMVQDGGLFTAEQKLVFAESKHDSGSSVTGPSTVGGVVQLKQVPLTPPALINVGAVTLAPSSSSEVAAVESDASTQPVPRVMEVGVPMTVGMPVPTKTAGGVTFVASAKPQL